MDRTLILDLSSDDEVTLDNTSTADNFDWITKLFEDVGGEIEDNPISNGGLFNFGNVVGGQNEEEEDNSDDVVVVGEVIVKKPKISRNLVPKNGDDDDDDDDCVVLDGDPDKPKDEVKESEEDSDDLCIVGETGQVACRDYPHPRHLCAKFPFNSTAHENCCDMCHCYICDSVAPCPLWGSGVSSIDHCHATDKEEYWKLERKRMRHYKNPTSPMPVASPITSSLPQRLHLQQISTGPNQLLRPTSTSGVSPTFGLPNIIRNQRSSIAVGSKRFQPHLVSRQILRSCNSHSQVQGNRGESLAPRVVSSRPMFKRSGLTSRPMVSNRPTCRAPNNVNVAFLQLPDQQLTGNATENNSANSTVSSLHLNLNATFCLPSTSSVSPGMLSPQLQGYSQPSSHTPISQFHGYGQSATVASNIPCTHTSMNQTLDVPGLPLPCNTNVQNSVTLCNEQQSGVTQTISCPNIPCSIPPDLLNSFTLRSNQTSAEQNYSTPILSCSTFSAVKSLSQSCQPSSAAENSLLQGGVPMHELLPSIEQNAQHLGNAEQLDFDFENWFQDSQPILGPQDSSFLLDMNNQASVTVPVDTGMLYFDFETSWEGLTHS